MEVSLCNVHCNSLLKTFRTNTHYIHFAFEVGSIRVCFNVLMGEIAFKSWVGTGDSVTSELHVNGKTENNLFERE